MIYYEVIEVKFHSVFEGINKMIETELVFGEGIAGYLNYIWHKLIRYLSIEDSPLISQCLQNGACKAKDCSRHRISDLRIELTQSFEKSQNRIFIIFLKSYQGTLLE